MDLALKELGDYISGTLGDAVEKITHQCNELIITIQRDRILGVLKFLRDDFAVGFEGVHKKIIRYMWGFLSFFGRRWLIG